MILAINISNDYLSHGVYLNDSLIYSFSLSRVDGTTSDEYSLFLKLFLSEGNICLEDIDGCCISSVVPRALVEVVKAVEKLFSVKPFIVGQGIKTGVNIRIENHTQLGADLVANVSGCNCLNDHSYIIVDFGVATTISYVNNKKEFIGVIIAPGVNTSAKALSFSAAALPDISISSPKSLIGKNTFDSMVSGCVLGNACMVDGLIERIISEYDASCVSLIATGTYASDIIPYCKIKFHLRSTLTLDGLKNIYYLNRG